jgi:hypothetical protein
METAPPAATFLPTSEFAAPRRAVRRLPRTIPSRDRVKHARGTPVLTLFK